MSRCVIMFKCAAAVAVIFLASCGGGGASTPSLPPSDAYENYLANNPDPSVVLTREDAQLRAQLGCGQTWAPGTIDYVLRQAYRVTCSKG